ncbi:MAG TPA: hypothetical protein VHG28_13760 [Longimicrobiaceae bacterium]|nr:hypothetical protein [Longimicrobiaceae bacterium]
MTRLVFALLLGAAACPATEPTPPGGDVRLEFTAQELREPTPPTPGVRAEGGEGRITVWGVLDTPDPCRKLSGEIQADGTELTLRVTTAPTGAVCVAVIGYFRYDAVLSGLGPGTYRLRVVQTYPGTGWETKTALDQSVTVR